jgi:hypothetical protein
VKRADRIRRGRKGHASMKDAHFPDYLARCAHQGTKPDDYSVYKEYCAWLYVVPLHSTSFWAAIRQAGLEVKAVRPALNQNGQSKRPGIATPSRMIVDYSKLN